MTTAFEIVAHQSASLDAGGAVHPPETVHIGPDVEDAALDLQLIAERYQHERGLHIRRLTKRFAYLSDGECFLSLYVREETA